MQPWPNKVTLSSSWSVHNLSQHICFFLPLSLHIVISRDGTIDVQEFAALWKYVQEWKGCFDR